MGTIHAPRLRDAAAVSVLIYASTGALAQPLTTASLVDLSLEDLAHVTITSVSRRAESIADAPASIYVITGEAIRRSGAASIPDALRLAPNLQVARIDARQYAITARGFNNAIANKLLVLIDGRTIYTPLFSGVFWDAQDTLLEDIERIEVISGPGATLWGANAVNGVINVITRRASDTIGAFAEAGAGNQERGIALRHGAALSGDAAWRLYGKFFDRDNTVRADGTAVADEWHNGQVGFRADWGTAASGITLQGDTYRATIDQAAPQDIRISGANLLARWVRSLGGADKVQVQSYLDRTERDIPGTFAEVIDTFDVEFQHGFKAGRRHYLTWGGGHRHADDRVTNSAALAFLPPERSLDWTNLFIQDEVELHERLRFTLGGKVEDNPYTGAEFLPSARIAWKPHESRLVWGALSRAVRAPSRIDREIFIPGQAPFLIAGGPQFRSEISRVAELGYRAQPSSTASYSVTAFRALHDHLRSVEPGAAGTSALGNLMEGTTTGLEFWGNLQPSANWLISLGGVLLDQDLRLRPGSGDVSGVAAAGNDPNHQLLLRSSVDLSGGQQFDLMLRHVGRLPSPAVPAYAALDARYAWRLRSKLQLSIDARNILDGGHPEFGAAPARSEIERSLFVRIRWSD